MSNNLSITVRVDKDIKLEAQSILSSLGLDMSTAINIFLRQVIENDGLPFDIKIKSPTATTLQALSETLNKTNLVGPFDTVEDLMNDLDE
jgi:DNA-damage-inducible protein J